jgi:hypothetical protein
MIMYLTPNFGQICLDVNGEIVGGEQEREISICQAERTPKMVAFRRAIEDLMGLQPGEALGQFECAAGRKKKSLPGLCRLFGSNEQVRQ